VQPHPFLQQGDLVRVLTGALSGMEGILTRTKNQYRIVISVQLLQKSIAVEIDAANVVRLTFSGARVNSSLSQVSA
jgi:ribosomal protein L24